MSSILTDDNDNRNFSSEFCFAELSAIENVLGGWHGCVEFSWNRTRILKLTRQRFTDFATRPPWAQALIFFVLKPLEGWQNKNFATQLFKKKNPPRNNNELRHEFHHENDHPKRKQTCLKTNDWDHSRNADKIRSLGRKDWQNCNLLYNTWMYDDVDISNVTVDRQPTT